MNLEENVTPTLKVAIIGGSGFVGTRLMRVMKNDPTIQFINIDKRQSKAFASVTHIANVLNRKLLGTALKGVDLVVLLAAEHRDDVSPVSRSEEHTSELQSRENLVCRLLLEKKKKQ